MLLAAELLGAQHAQLSLIGEEQHAWTSTPEAQVRPQPPSPREDSLCTVTVSLREPLLVPDAPDDARVCHLPPVAGGAVGAYLGVPLFAVTGEVLGALCVFHPTPRPWDERDVAVLSGLATGVSAELQLRAVTVEAGDATTRLDLALDATGIGSYDMDADGGGDLVWDDRLLALFGYDADTFGGDMSSFMARVHPEDRARVEAGVAHCLQETGELVLEYRIVRPDGEVRWVEARGRVREVAGRRRLVGVGYDSTELRTARDRLSRTLETMTDAFCSLDRSFRFTYVNRRAEQLLGRSREELLGRVLWEEFPALLGTEDERHYRTALAQDEPAAFETARAQAGGIHEVSVWPGPDGLSVYFREITARRAVERERARAQALAEAAQARMALLVRAGEGLSQGLDPRGVLQALSDVVLPGLGDGLVVALTADTLGAYAGQEVTGDLEHVRVVHVRHVDPDRQAALQDLLSRLPLSVQDPAGVGRVVRTRAPEWLPEVPDEVLAAFAPDPALLDELRAVVPSRALSLPLLDRGTVLGAVTVNEPSTDPADRALLEAVVERAAVALDNALLFQAARGAAQTLQQSLLPRELPAHPGVRSSVVYLPGSTGAEVGGDWYQGVRVGDRLVLAMGDVMGHGMRSAALMGQLRAVVATLALDGCGPGALLTRLGGMLDSGDLLDLDLATLLVAEVRPDGTLRVASAGHPPPALVVPGAAPVFLDVVPGPPLGTVPVPYAEIEAHLPPGATLVLYTDGLIERRDEDLDAGLERLRDALTAPQPDPAAVTEHVLAALGRSQGNDDDVALLVLRRDDGA